MIKDKLDLQVSYSIGTIVGKYGPKIHSGNFTFSGEDLPENCLNLLQSRGFVQRTDLNQRLLFPIDTIGRYRLTEAFFQYRRAMETVQPYSTDPSPPAAPQTDIVEIMGELDDSEVLIE